MEPELTDKAEYPAIDIGAQLRRAREAAGLSVDDISSDLRIHVNYVEALEKNNFEILNGPTYVKGYIRNYARLLEIDSNPLIEAYQSSVGEVPAWNASHPLQEEKAHRKGMLTGSVIIVLAMLALFGTWLLKSGYLDRYQVDAVQSEVDSNTAEDELTDTTKTHETAEAGVDSSSKPEGLTIKEQVQALNPQAAGSVETSSGETQADTQEPSSSPEADKSNENAIILGEDDFITAPDGEGTDEIIITFTEDCWVEIKDASRNQLMHGLYKAGDIKVVLSEAPFQVFLGNAKAVQIDFNGTAFDIAASTRRNNSARFALVNQ